MTATFVIPTNLLGSTDNEIYVKTTDDGSTYELFDTIPGYQKEYMSTGIATSSLIKVGTTSVTTFEKDLIARVRLLCQITDTDLSDDSIVAYVPVARREVLLEIAQYKYGEQLSLIIDNYYTLPNKYLFDFNCGGVISPLDIEVFKQTLPLYVFTTKEPVTIIDMNVKDGWVQLDTELTGNEILKINYYYLQRDAQYDDIITLLAWKIASLQYAAAYTTYSTGIGTDTSQVKIGDITVKSAAESASINFIKDRMAKSEAQFKKAVAYFKQGFYRVK